MNKELQAFFIRHSKEKLKININHYFEKKQKSPQQISKLNFNEKYLQMQKKDQNELSIFQPKSTKSSQKHCKTKHFLLSCRNQSQQNQTKVKRIRNLSITNFEKRQMEINQKQKTEPNQVKKLYMTLDVLNRISHQYSSTKEKQFSTTNSEFFTNQYSIKNSNLKSIENQKKQIEELVIQMDKIRQINLSEFKHMNFLNEYEDIPFKNIIKNTLEKLNAESRIIDTNLTQMKFSSDRQMILSLQQWMQHQLSEFASQNQLNITDLFFQLQDILAGAISELVRQNAIQCQERGQLIQKIWNANRSMMSQIFFESTVQRFKREKLLQKELVTCHQLYQSQFQELLNQKKQVEQINEQTLLQIDKLMLEHKYLKKKNKKNECDILSIKEQFEIVNNEFEKLRKENFQLKNIKLEDQIIEEFKRQNPNFQLNTQIHYKIQQKIQPLLSQYSQEQQISGIEFLKLNDLINIIIKDKFDQREEENFCLQEVRNRGEPKQIIDKMKNIVFQLQEKDTQTLNEFNHKNTIVYSYELNGCLEKNTQTEFEQRDCAIQNTPIIKNTQIQTEPIEIFSPEELQNLMQSIHQQNKLDLQDKQDEIYELQNGILNNEIRTIAAYKANFQKMKQMEFEIQSSFSSSQNSVKQMPSLENQILNTFDWNSEQSTDSEKDEENQENESNTSQKQDSQSNRSITSPKSKSQWSESKKMYLGSKKSNFFNQPQNQKFNFSQQSDNNNLSVKNNRDAQQNKNILLPSQNDFITFQNSLITQDNNIQQLINLIINSRIFMKIEMRSNEELLRFKNSLDDIRKQQVITHESLYKILSQNKNEFKKALKLQIKNCDQNVLLSSLQKEKILKDQFENKLLEEYKISLACLKHHAQENQKFKEEIDILKNQNENLKKSLQNKQSSPFRQTAINYDFVDQIIPQNASHFSNRKRKDDQLENFFSSSESDSQSIQSKLVNVEIAGKQDSHQSSKQAKQKNRRKKSHFIKTQSITKENKSDQEQESIGDQCEVLNSILNEQKVLMMHNIQRIKSTENIQSQSQLSKPFKFFNKNLQNKVNFTKIDCKDKILKAIQKIYLKKINGQFDNEISLVNLLYLYVQNKYDSKRVAQQKLASFCSNLLQYCQKSGCPSQMLFFANFLGIQQIKDADPLLSDNIIIFDFYVKNLYKINHELNMTSFYLNFDFVKEAFIKIYDQKVKNRHISFLLEQLIEIANKTQTKKQGDSKILQIEGHEAMKILMNFEIAQIRNKLKEKKNLLMCLDIDNKKFISLDAFNFVFTSMYWQQQISLNNCQAIENGALIFYKYADMYNISQEKPFLSYMQFIRICDSQKIFLKQNNKNFLLKNKRFMEVNDAKELQIKWKILKNQIILKLSHINKYNELIKGYISFISDYFLSENTIFLKKLQKLVFFLFNLLISFIHYCEIEDKLCNFIFPQSLVTFQTCFNNLIKKQFTK